MRTLFALFVGLGKWLFERLDRARRRRRAARDGGRMHRDRGHSRPTTARRATERSATDGPQVVVEVASVQRQLEPALDPRWLEAQALSTARGVRARLRSRSALREAVVLAEILDRPLALRPPRH